VSASSRRGDGHGVVMTAKERGVRGVLSRPTDTEAVDNLLSAASEEPAALVVEGEAGIGKTTLWLGALDRARDRGFRVLAAQAAVAESVLAYTGVADLLSGLDDEWSDVPDIQRVALSSMLLGETPSNAADWRVLAAAFLAVLDRLAEQAPVLIAIDDLQWLDASSRHILGFAARRLPSRVGLLATVRSGSSDPDPVSWLQLSRPDALRRFTLAPMSLSALHELLSRRLQVSFSRPTIVKIHEVSGGNPLFALELARVLDTESLRAGMPLPPTLMQLVYDRIGPLNSAVRTALLTAACAASPTITLVAVATGTGTEEALKQLEEAESRGIITIDGHRLHFTHPLLAHGVYSEATPAQRRAIHRRLAEVLEQPELQARHLALGATSADARTLESLDAAAEMVRGRGAPAAAAELLELAINLGGDAPRRRIRLAQHHFDAGDTARARALLEAVIDELPPGTTRAEALLTLGFLRLFDDSHPDAAALLERALEDAREDLSLTVRVGVTFSFTLFNAGYLERAMQVIGDAVTGATRLEQPSLLSQALSMKAILAFIRGDGLDEASLDRALELYDPHDPIPVPARPPVQNALLLAWTGRLDEARRQMLAIRQSCLQRGEEGELIFVGFHSVLIEVWRGYFGDAELLAEDLLERATQQGGDFPLFIALTTRALIAAYAGREQQVRDDIADAIDAAGRSGSQRMGEWAITTLGFLEVSLGNYPAALATLEPLVSRLAGATEQTEIIAAAFAADAVEAMVALGRLDDAEQLTAAMERNGRRVNRAWTLAVGARCRSMLFAAHGDLDAALRAAQLAMKHHERLPMPFETARTQLLLGELQRRQRLKDASAATLREALRVFELLGTPLWAQRARGDLARANVRRTQTGDGLTASERRVAELVATGMTNRAVASSMFISPKTVEANLARIYRKLNIHSRVELARYASETLT